MIVNDWSGNMNKKFIAVVILSMIFLGAICGYTFCIIFMMTRESLLIHCVSTGIIYGLINSLFALFFIHRYSILKVDKQKLEQEIRIDKLTELYNRYAFEEDIKSLNNSSTYTVIYLDIDDFSKFNNTYGHEAGDIVLKNAAKTIKGSIRNIDKAYRYGGEELIVILDECAKELALKIGNRIIDNIRNSDNTPYPGITVSAGLASAPDDAESFANLLKAGDTALYRAKELGKDRLVSYQKNMEQDFACKL